MSHGSAVGGGVMSKAKKVIGIALGVIAVIFVFKIFPDVMAMIDQLIGVIRAVFQAITTAMSDVTAGLNKTPQG